MTKHGFLWLAALVTTAWSFPSFRHHVPNGLRVPCPSGATGCDLGDASLGEPESVCRGLGHATCAGASMPLNVFGEALKANEYRWTEQLCMADSDGDGLTNGEELGDPCCAWKEGDGAAPYMMTWTPSHPGMASDRPASYSKPSCDETTQPGFRSPGMARFNEGEEQRHVDFRVKDYQVPEVRTEYADFVFNFDDEEHDIYHIVYGIALVDQPKLLHHFVVTGCYEKVAPEMSGQRMPRPESCVMPVGGFAGWAPGAILWDMPIYAGVPVGKGVGIVAFHVQVHYTDGDVYPGTISKDGIRIYYTPTLRNQTVDSVSTIGIGTHPRMLVPPSKDRYFLTRTCTVVDPCQSADCQGKVWSRPIVSVFYHAHLLGVAMYQSLTRGNTTWDLGSQSRWHYDDQAMFPLMSRNLTVQAGDVIQSTCIFDSQGRTEATPMGLNTWDEMCFTQVNIARPSADPIVGFGCGGPMWEGDLQVTEDAFHVATLHPIDQAQNAWQATSYGQATRFLPKNQRDCQQMACRERGEWDDDCCGLKTETSCADGLTKIETNDICWQGFGFTAYYTCCAHAENSSESSFAAGAENGFRGRSWMLLLSVFGLLH